MGNMEEESPKDADVWFWVLYWFDPTNWCFFFGGAPTARDSSDASKLQDIKLPQPKAAPVPQAAPVPPKPSEAGLSSSKKLNDLLTTTVSSKDK